MQMGAGDAETLGVGELVKRGIGGSWVNPAYWNRQFVTASHIANNVKNGSNVIELGKDAKNLYYLNAPTGCTLIVPPANQEVSEGPIREAAAKLGVPFTLFTDKALDELPIRRGTYDAALCFDMLDGAPEQAKAGAIAVLASSLKVGGQLLFLERSESAIPQLMREFDFGDRLTVEFETEGGYDVGIATRRSVGRSVSKRKAIPASKAKKAQRIIPESAIKGGFGGGAGAVRKPTVDKEAVRQARQAAKAEAKLRREAEAAAAEAAAEAAERAEAEAAARAAAEAAARTESERVAKAEAEAAERAAAEAKARAAAEAAARAEVERIAKVAAEAAEQAAAEAAERAAAEAAERAAAEAAEQAAAEAAEQAAAEVAAAEAASGAETSGVPPPDLAEALRALQRQVAELQGELAEISEEVEVLEGKDDRVD